MVMSLIPWILTSCCYVVFVSLYCENKLFLLRTDNYTSGSENKYSVKILNPKQGSGIVHL